MARRTSTSSSGSAALVGLALLTVASSAAAREGDEARSRAEEALHRLGYLAADYPRAVVEGKVMSEAEHQEHAAIAADLVGDARRIAAATGRGPELVDEAEAFRARVAAAAPAAEIAARIHDLEDEIIGAARIDLAPSGTPNRERGKTLYGEACAACHGLRGHPDPSIVRSMRPAPVDFFDPHVVEPLSPARIVFAVRFGVDGTAMPAFPTVSREAEDDLGAFVLTLRHGDRTTPRTPRYAPAELARMTDGELADDLFAAGAETYELPSMLAELRGKVAFEDEGAAGPFGEARASLFRAAQRITWGDDADAARELALAEHACRDEVRGALGPLAPALATEIEERFVALRARLIRNEPRRDLERDVDVIARALTRAQIVLAGDAPPPPKLGMPMVVPPRPRTTWFSAGALAAFRASVVPLFALAAIRGRWSLRGRRAEAIALFIASLALLPAVMRWAAALSALGARGGAAATAGIVVGIAASIAGAYLLAEVFRRFELLSKPFGALGAATLAAWLAGQVVGALELGGVLARRLLPFVGAPELSIYPSALAIVGEVAAAAITLALVLRRGAPRYPATRSDRTPAEPALAE